MAKKLPPDPQPAEDPVPQPTFEEALTRLEAIVHDLEDGELGLNESLARYEDGVKLLRRCYELLEGAERRIELVSGVDAEGNPLTQPFDDRSTLSMEEQGPARSRKRTAPGTRSSSADKLGNFETDMDDGGGAD